MHIPDGSSDIDMAHPAHTSPHRAFKMAVVLKALECYQTSEYDITPLPHVAKYLNSVRYIEELQKFVEDDQYKKNFYYIIKCCGCILAELVLGVFIFHILKGPMNNQLAELLAEPSGEFENFVRLSLTDFEYLVQKISPIVSKQDTDWREAIPVKIRIAVTLRFLATSDSYRSLHYLFKISRPLISRLKSV